MLIPPFLFLEPVKVVHHLGEGRSMLGLVRARVSYQGQQQVAFGARRLVSNKRQEPRAIRRIEYVCLLRYKYTRAVAAFALRFGRPTRPLRARLLRDAAIVIIVKGLLGSKAKRA